jgi:hypothetical protein
MVGAEARELWNEFTDNPLSTTLKNIQPALSATMNPAKALGEVAINRTIEDSRGNSSTTTSSKSEQNITVDSPRIEINNDASNMNRRDKQDLVDQIAEKLGDEIKRKTR